MVTPKELEVLKDFIGVENRSPSPGNPCPFYDKDAKCGALGNPLFKNKNGFCTVPTDYADACRRTSGIK